MPAQRLELHMLLNFIAMKEIDLANSEAEAIYVIEDDIIERKLIMPAQRPELYVLLNIVF